MGARTGRLTSLWPDAWSIVLPICPDVISEPHTPTSRSKLYIVSLLANDSFRAVAHPIRRGIVERLARGSATVGVATLGFGVSKPTISKHVRILEGAGVVVRTIEGRTHRLRLKPEALFPAAKWFDNQRMVWERMFDAVEDVLGGPDENQ